MFRRLLAAVLALVLVWTGLATQEPPDLQQAFAAASSDESSRPGQAPGAVDEHHLDDLSGTAPDLPDALRAPPGFAAHDGMRNQLPRFEALAPPLPHLPRPTRPPTAHGFT